MFQSIESEHPSADELQQLLAAFDASAPSEAVQDLVTIQPADHSARSLAPIEAVAMDWKDDQIRAISPRALLPGDHFAIESPATEAAESSMRIVVCHRCTMLRAGTFEIALIPLYPPAHAQQKPA